MRAPAVHRALQSEVAAARRRLGFAPRVLDVGGGSGVWSVPLAGAGCTVTVVDTSPNALATLLRRAAEAGVQHKVTALQGDADSLAEVVGAGSADLVLGHGLLEVVEDERLAIGCLATATAAGGVVSVLAANRYAAVLAAGIAGRMNEAKRLLDDPVGHLGPGDSVLRRFDTEGLTQLVVGAGLAVELVQGDGVLGDLMPGGVLDSHPGVVDQLAELELAAAGRAPLRDLASRLHVLARRPGG